MNITKNDKIEYHKICSLEKTIPLFSQDWWMDAVTNRNWNVHLYKKNNGEILGAFVYFYKKLENNKYCIEKAPISQNNGIWVNHDLFENYYNYRKYEEKIMDEMIRDIYNLNISSYSQQFHYSITNWLPFFWEYFQCVVRYTYVIDTTKSLDSIFDNFSSKNKNCIRKASKIVHLVEDIDPDVFYELNKLTFLRQNIEIPYSYELFKRVDDGCSTHNCRKILAAYDNDNKLHAAIYLVWDNDSVYYLFSGSDPEFRNSQANSFLIYEGIKFAKSIGRKFDFEGSVIRRVEKNIRQFGGVAIPYFKIFKDFERNDHDGIYRLKDSI